jgi:hypothetical protein
MHEYSKGCVQLKSSVVALLLAVTCLSGHAQLKPEVSKFTNNASVTTEPDGQVRIDADSPRPLWQAVTALARRNGLVIDYEDPWYKSSDMYADESGRKRLIGGSFVASVPQVSNLETESAALQQLVQQFTRQNRIPFKLIAHPEGKRFDVAGVSSAGQALFDTPVLLEKKPRAVEEAVQEITKQVERKRGTKIVEGGLVNGGLSRTEVILGGPEP